MSAPTVSVVVPTFRRESVLVETIERLLALASPALEILIVDQTPRHEPETDELLGRLVASQGVRWLRMEKPSIPQAMNRGLLAARADVVLFLDDDIEPSPKLVAAHAAAHAAGSAEIVAGQVLQPGEAPEALVAEAFAFRSAIPQACDEFMGGNFSVRRDFALAIGGFDENFVGAAYRFEAEFAARARRAGGRILFEPNASVQHLRAAAGGTRTWGDHLRTIRPFHAVGEYYFLLKTRPRGFWRSLLARPWRAVRTHHHLRRPWWLPVTFAAELAGALWACRLVWRGERLLEPRRSGEAGR